MEYRFLGNSGLKVSALSLGSWATYGVKSGEEECAACMEIAYKAGINFFDNAEVYGKNRGDAETIMGNVLAKFNWPRESYVLSTKLFWGGDGVNEKGLSRKHLLAGMNASLKRLQVDYVDLVFAHRPDSLTPMEEVVRAFTKIVQDGKALYWGVCYATVEEVARNSLVTRP